MTTLPVSLAPAPLDRVRALFTTAATTAQEAMAAPDFKEKSTLLINASTYLMGARDALFAAIPESAPLVASLGQDALALAQASGYAVVGVYTPNPVHDYVKAAVRSSIRDITTAVALIDSTPPAQPAPAVA